VVLNTSLQYYSFEHLYALSTSTTAAMFSQLTKITDELYISPAMAVTPDKVRRAGVALIINCTIEIPIIRIPDVEVIKINVDDLPTARIGVYFDRCADRIKGVHDRGGRTLVHCAAGVSRSASICIAYLMKYHRMTLREAYNHMKSCRQIIRPNPGFFRQLIDYELRLFGKSTVTMITSPMGFIPDVYQDEARNMVMLTSGPTGLKLR
jgi:atypical dual specificity phosphatase